MGVNVENLKELLESRFGGVQSKMARVLGVNRHQLNAVLNNDGKLAGKKIIGAIIKYCEINELDFHDYVNFF